MGSQFQIHFPVFSELLIVFIEFFFDMSILCFAASLSSFPVQFYVRGASLFLCHGLPWLPQWFIGRESACQFKRCKRCRFDSCVGKIPWNRKWQPTPAFLPGKFRGQRSLANYSLWGLQRIRHNLVTKHACTIWTVWWNPWIFFSN